MLIDVKVITKAEVSELEIVDKAYQLWKESVGRIDWVMLNDQWVKVCRDVGRCSESPTEEEYVVEKHFNTLYDLNAPNKWILNEK